MSGEAADRRGVEEVTGRVGVEGCAMTWQVLLLPWEDGVLCEVVVGAVGDGVEVAQVLQVAQLALLPLPNHLHGGAMGQTGVLSVNAGHIRRKPCEVFKCSPTSATRSSLSPASSGCFMSRAYTWGAAHA